MQIGGVPLKGELNVDLTRYHPNAKKGAKCTTIPNCKLSIWGSQDRFVAVKFDEGGTLDILWDGFERKEVEDAKVL